MLTITAVVNPHVPDIRTHDGLLDLIALGCILEFATALSRERYNEDYDHASPESWRDFTEQSQARTWFRVILKTFATKYTTVIKGKLVHPSCIWETVLVNFASAVVSHLDVEHISMEEIPGLTPEAVEEALHRHLSSDYPHLVAPFEAAIETLPRQNCLSWNGSRIQIQKKTRVFDKMLAAMGITEALHCASSAILSEGADSGVEELNKYFSGVWLKDV